MDAKGGPMSLRPFYTRSNCRFAFRLQWGVTVFWRSPPRDDLWFVAAGSYSTTLYSRVKNAILRETSFHRHEAGGEVFLKRARTGIQTSVPSGRARWSRGLIVGGCERLNAVISVLEHWEFRPSMIGKPKFRWTLGRSRRGPVQSNVHV